MHLLGSMWGLGLGVSGFGIFGDGVLGDPKS